MVSLVVAVVSVDVPWAEDRSFADVWEEVLDDGFPDDLPVRC